jgi:hypothetical protein
MNDPMNPSSALLAKLCSIIVHQEEFEATGHEFDRQAAISLRQHPDVAEWMMDMKKLGLAPVKRYG